MARDIAKTDAYLTSRRERKKLRCCSIVLSDGVLFNYRGQIGVMALRDRLPAISSASEYAQAGLLLTYGPDLRDLFRRSAVFVDKIFRGAKPADLPVEQPIKYELVINLKTAYSLGLEPLARTPRSRRRGHRMSRTTRAGSVLSPGHARNYVILARDQVSVL
jgi:hypothetical protein